MNEIRITPTDLRRAVAAMRHAANEDTLGVFTIVEEAADRSVEFVYAVLDVHRRMLIAAYDEGGAHEVLNEWTLQLAAQETGETS